MFANGTSGNVIDMPREHLHEAVDVLTLAFEYAPAPLMRYFFAEQGADYHGCLRAMLNLVCESQLALQEPLKGCVHQGQLVGVACIIGPESKPQPSSLAQAEEAFKALIGPTARLRLEQVGHRLAGYRPAHPHLYLTVIGVHPHARGKGFGRTLLTALHTLSESHPTSTGVGLDTANPANVPLYEHFGYQVIAKTRFDDIVVWSMFRPNAGQIVICLPSAA